LDDVVQYFISCWLLSFLVDFILPLYPLPHTLFQPLAIGQLPVVSLQEKQKAFYWILVLIPGGSDKAKLEAAPMKRVEGRKANKVSARESV